MLQATRGSSPAATRVRYGNKPPRSKSKSKTPKKPKSKARPPVPSYADGYAEDEDLREQRDPEDADPEEDRPRKRPSKSSSSGKKSTYPKGWGPDGGYRVPAPAAPQYPPFGSPYGTEEEEPGTGHLDLEERFINQHNQFYRHGYPADSSEAVPASTQSKKHKGYFEDEEIEVAEADDFAPDGLTASSNSQRGQKYRRPSSKTRYSLQDGKLRPDEQQDSEEYRRPTKATRSKKKSSNRHQSMYHAKFRGQQDDRTLSAANFNYELSGAASETAHATVNTNNHRPAYDSEPSTDLNDPNFFRTRKPQYWG